MQTPIWHSEVGAMSNSRKPVKACICFEVTFEQLKAAGMRSIDEVRAKFGCTTKCGTCQPYIELMLQTEETEFAVIYKEQ